MICDREALVPLEATMDLIKNGPKAKNTVSADYREWRATRLGLGLIQMGAKTGADANPDHIQDVMISTQRAGFEMTTGDATIAASARSDRATLTMLRRQPTLF